MKRNCTKEANKAHNNTLKEEILQAINENYIEIILYMVNQNVQEIVKKFQDNKNKECETAQEQIKETIEALNNHQRETKKTINTAINKLRSKIDNIIEEITHDMESLRKRNETEIQNIMEGHSSRLEQAEDKISELEYEMVIKGKTEKIGVTQLKTYERNMQEFTETSKDQTWKSWALMKEKICKQKKFIIYSTK
jgi:hypothetical protein